MARDFNGTTQHGTGTAQATAVPLTFSAWVNLDDATNGVIAGLIRNSVASWYGWYLSITAGGTLNAATADNNSFAVGTQTGLTTGTWQHVAGVISSATSRTAYVDGVAGTTNTTSKTPSSTAGLAMCAGASVRSSTDTRLNGRIAELSIWNAALTTDEIASLADRVSPILVQPVSIVSYYPLIGRTSPEIDVFGFGNMTLVNTPTQSDHPPMRYPGRVQAWKYGAAAPGGGIVGPLIGSGHLMGRGPLIGGRLAA